MQLKTKIPIIIFSLLFTLVLALTTVAWDDWGYDSPSDYYDSPSYYYWSPWEPPYESPSDYYWSPWEPPYESPSDYPYWSPWEPPYESPSDYYWSPSDYYYVSPSDYYWSPPPPEPELEEGWGWSVDGGWTYDGTSVPEGPTTEQGVFYDPNTDPVLIEAGLVECIPQCAYPYCGQSDGCGGTCSGSEGTGCLQGGGCGGVDACGSSCSTELLSEGWCSGACRWFNFCSSSYSTDDSCGGCPSGQECSGGSCVEYECTVASDCGTPASDSWCSDVARGGQPCQEYYYFYSCVNNMCGFHDGYRNNDNCGGCPSGQKCSGGSCVSIACYDETDCNDNNPCTFDACYNPGSPSSYCGNPYKGDGTACTTVGGESGKCLGGSCVPKGCIGTVSLSLSSNIIGVSKQVTPTASGLSNCWNKIVYFKPDSCWGNTLSTCTIGTDGTGCTGTSFVSPEAEGDYNYVACIDKDENGFFD